MKKHTTVIRMLMLVYILAAAYGYVHRTPIRFLLVDSLLAYVPLELYHMINWVHAKKLKVLVFLLYLLFLPNNAYLLTDLIHLSRIPFYQTSNVVMTDAIGIWTMYFLVVAGILSLVALGLESINGLCSQLATQYRLSVIQQRISLVFLLGLISVGVFLGRFIRLNSVTVFSHPLKVLVTLQELFTIRALFFIVMFTCLQYILYFWICLRPKKRE